MENVSSSNSHKDCRPTLRFNGFYDKWSSCPLSNIAEINPSNSALPNNFYYIDLESVVKGNLIRDIKTCKSKAPSRAQRLVTVNDILFQTVRPYQQNNYIFEQARDLPTVASTGYALIRTKETPYFLYVLMHTKNFLDKVQIRCTGSSYPAINGNDLGEIIVSIPNKEEQCRIADFIKLLDYRIKIQNKLLSFLKSYKRGLLFKLFDEQQENSKYKNLGSLCCITTGKLDANASEEDGQYPFFTCGRTTLTINNFAFDGEAILIAGNGDIGHTKYYNGKFNAYQRTYVLTNFLVDAHYLRHAIDIFLPRRIVEETQGGAMPYIKLSTLSDLNLPLLTKERQCQINKTIGGIDRNILYVKQLLSRLEKLKLGLLQSLFI